MDVRAYPTWLIGGRRYEGVLSLPRLAELSGFTGTPEAAATGQGAAAR